MTTRRGLFGGAIALGALGAAALPKAPVAKPAPPGPKMVVKTEVVTPKSVVLPEAVAGTIFTVVNLGTAGVQAFPPTGGAIRNPPPLPSLKVNQTASMVFDGERWLTIRSA